MLNNDWYSKKIMPFFAFMSITVILVFSGRNVRLGQSSDMRYLVYSIEFEYFGMVSGELEREITIPLEEKLGSMTGVYDLRSVTENNKVTATVRFGKKRDSKKTYLDLRNIVDTLYRQLPAAVQKPRIYSASADSRAVFSFTISSQESSTDLRQYAENTLKKRFEAIPGVAEVIISGGSLYEVRITFDPEHLVAENLNPSVFSQIVRDANVVYPGSTIYGKNYDSSIRFNTKLQTLEQIRKLPVKLKNEYTTVGALADISFDIRPQEEIVRVNGQEAVAVQIKSASEGNPVRISEECRKILVSSDFAGYQIITDEGRTQGRLIKQVSSALLQSFLGVLLIIPFFYTSATITVLILFSIFVTLLWTVCELSAAGLAIDQNIISGLSISLGLIVDPMLVLGETGKAERRTLLSITASAITTVLVLIPLYFMEYIVPGIRAVIITIALMILNSLVISCVFFPCYAYGETRYKLLPSKLTENISYWYRTATKPLVHTGFRFSGIVCISYASFIIFSAGFFQLSGKNITLDRKNDIIFATVEYEPGKQAAAIDRDITDFIDKIRHIQGIQFVRSECRKGAADLEIGYDIRKAGNTEITMQIKKFSPLLADGFLYIPAAAYTARKVPHELEIAVTGEENSECRQFAEKAVETVTSDPETVQVVLNFKQNEKNVVFTGDRSLIVRNGIDMQTIASTLHWMFSGPVVDKWFKNNAEYDIRVSGKGLQRTVLPVLAAIHIPTSRGGVRLGTLGTLNIGTSIGKIYHYNGKRAAFFTIQSSAASTDKAQRHIQSDLAQIALPKGYGFIFSKEIDDMQQQYKRLFTVCIFSCIMLFLFLSAVTENIKESLLIISAIPVAALLPLTIKFFSGNALQTGDLTGMVVLSGITINNAIYISYSAGNSMTLRLSEKIRSILVTSLTTVAGALPLAVSSSSGGFPEALAFFMLWGTLGSLVCTLLFFPAVYGKCCAIGE